MGTEGRESADSVAPRTRAVLRAYRDPLDQIWLVTAHRLGLRVLRDDDVFASTDGRGTLRIGAPRSLDADDCLAQMIFHELCHALVEGPESFSRADWGLDNRTDRDAPRERACLRVQAALAARYGLREFLAPTTDARAEYDALPVDPLAPHEPEDAALARAAIVRAESAPFAPHLQAALTATASIVGVARGFSERLPDEPLPPLYS